MCQRPKPLQQQRYHLSVHLAACADRKLDRLETILTSCDCPRYYYGYGPKPRQYPKPVHRKENFGQIHFFKGLLVYLLTAGTVASIPLIASLFTVVFTPYAILALFCALVSIVTLSTINPTKKLCWYNLRPGEINADQSWPKSHDIVILLFIRCNCCGLPVYLSRLLILALLARAGDVEKNPGPGRRDTQSEQTDAVQVPDQQATNSESDHQDERILQPLEPSLDQVQLPDSKTTVPFQSAGEDTSPQSTTDSQDGPTDFKVTTTGMQPMESQSPGSKHTLDSQSSVVSRSTSTPSAPRKPKHQHSKSQIDYKKFLEDLKIEVYYDLDGLNVDKHPERFFELLCNANTLYRLGENCPVCPMCLKRKGKGDKVKSHVIPRTVLQEYWKIHGDGAKEFIYDFSRAEPLGCGGLTYRLFCSACEKKYSQFEKQLANLYKYIAGKPMEKKFRFGDNTNIVGLHFILANILFRGILANANLRDIGIANFIPLWKYCKTFEQSHVQLPDLRLCLLPNKHFNEEQGDFMYPFEMLLRMPRCTELIKEREGTFFYCKFDIFHLVLPVCESSKEYFRTFKNCLNVENNCIHWSVQPKAQRNEIKNQMFKSWQFVYPTDHELVNHFPEVLLRWCCSLYPKYIQRIFNHPKPPRRHSVFLERYDFSAYNTAYVDDQYPGFKTERRLNICSELHSQASQTIGPPTGHECLLTYEIIVRGKFDHKECLQSAKDHSPLRTQIDVKRKIQELDEHRRNLVEELGATREELGVTKEELGATREELGVTKEELGATKEELGATREKLTMKTRKLENTEKMLKKEKLRRVRSDSVLQSTHTGFLETKRSRYEELREKAIRSRQCVQNNDIGFLRSTISAQIKDLEEQIKRSRSNRQFCFECKQMQKNFAELVTWLPSEQNLPRLELQRYHSHS